ncbi:MAG TPA: DNA polymerase III subunit gamma/tau [Solirubrobacteraceae bacterium]|nr:DNA polymerase III subunit gamma/tau [Solirubrobacteraceae bacterium]
MSTGPSLYRRHRPRTFGEVVGQEHVVRTLRNAVEQGKVHHAYLFVGARGTGKTSMAKILAACLNCEQGPTTEPCGRCESCTSIAAATSLDVIEMDAASNNSVDDIRDLRERVAYAPVSGRHKVYILDEAHMLSTQAWNAFLKTLEEPPTRTIFVLATTEPQKVLPTVADRCHRFDFGRPSISQVVTVLRRVSDQEEIEIDDHALALIARHATGSFRDALGTLEQLRTYKVGEAIAPSDVIAVVGVADDELLRAAIEAIAARDPAQALRTAAALADSGRDPGQVLRDLESYARELLAVQVLGELPIELRMTPERDQRVAQQAQSVSRSDVVRLLDLIAGALEATANGAQAQIQLELVLVKSAAPEVDPSTTALLARIERLEAGGVSVASEPQEQTAPGAPASVAPAAPDPAPQSGIDLDRALELWPAVVAQVRERNALLAALLAEARPTATGESELTLAFPAGAAFLRRKAEQEEHRRLAAEVWRGVSGCPLALRYELGDNDEHEDGAPALSGEELVRRFIEEFDAEELHEEDSEQREAQEG